MSCIDSSKAYPFENAPFVSVFLHFFKCFRHARSGQSLYLYFYIFLTVSDMRGADGKKKKFKPLSAVRKLFGGKKRKKEETVVAVKAQSTTALHSSRFGEDEDEDDDDGG